jgi:hypothetical protein
MAKKDNSRKTLELNVHWKQGDDFGEFLKAKKDKVVPALIAWAESLESSAKALREIATRVEGERAIKAEGGTHYVAIHGVPAALATEIVKATEGLAAIEDDHPGRDEEE